MIKIKDLLLSKHCSINGFKNENIKMYQIINQFMKIIRGKSREVKVILRKIKLV